MAFDTALAEQHHYKRHMLPPMKIHEGFKWKDASRFLERAHLQNHCIRGNDKPSNIVLLCPLCHRAMSAMPRFQSRKEALRWVSERYSHRMRTSSTALHDASWQIYTDTHLCCDKDDIRELYKLFLISIMLQAQRNLSA